MRCPLNRYDSYAKRGITLGPNGGYLSFDGTGLNPYDGIISGTLGGALSPTGRCAQRHSAGTISLNSANTYNGPTRIGNGMTLSVGIRQWWSQQRNWFVSKCGCEPHPRRRTLPRRRNEHRPQFHDHSRGRLHRYRAETTTLRSPSRTPPRSAWRAPEQHILVLRGTSTGDNILSQAIADPRNSGHDRQQTRRRNVGPKEHGKRLHGQHRHFQPADGSNSCIRCDPERLASPSICRATLDPTASTKQSDPSAAPPARSPWGPKRWTLNDPSGETYSAHHRHRAAASSRMAPENSHSAQRPPRMTAASRSTPVFWASAQTALGTGPVVVNNSPTLAAAGSTAVSLTNAVTLSGNVTFNDSFTTPGAITGRSGANKWTITGGDRTITVNTASGTYGVTINQVIGEDALGRSLIKAGNGNLTLNAANTYSGNTIVQGGQLKLGTPSLFDAADVVLAAGTVINLNFSASTPDTVNAFYIDGVKLADGIWGAVGPIAPYQTASITGTGFLNVIPYVPPISGQPLPGDFNNDGKVDAGDYMTWRKANGTSNALLNDNGLGTPIGQAHLDLWRQQFGNATAPGGGLGGGTIPEPNTLMLMLFGAFAMLTSQVRRCLAA